jgi:hypothetical protein
LQELAKRQQLLQQRLFQSQSAQRQPQQTQQQKQLPRVLLTPLLLLTVQRAAAAVAIQSCWRAHSCRLLHRVAEQALLNRAARVVQRAWRACECLHQSILSYLCDDNGRLSRLLMLVMWFSWLTELAWRVTCTLLLFDTSAHTVHLPLKQVLSLVQNPKLYAQAVCIRCICKLWWALWRQLPSTLAANLLKGRAGCILWLATPLPNHSQSTAVHCTSLRLLALARCSRATAAAAAAVWCVVRLAVWPAAALQQHHVCGCGQQAAGGGSSRARQAGARPVPRAQVRRVCSARVSYMMASTAYIGLHRLV